MSGVATQVDFSLYDLRRKDLIAQLRAKHADIKCGAVVLFGNFEDERYAFRQESSFYYYTGVEEPGAALVLNLDGTSTLYVPNCSGNREQWVLASVDLMKEGAHKQIGVSAIEPLGDACSGYQFYPFFKQDSYKNLITHVADIVGQSGTIFSLCPSNGHEYVLQRFVLNRFATFVPGMAEALVDVSPLVAAARRKKDMREIELLYRALEITAMGQEAAALAIVADVPEAEVQAALEYVFTTNNCRRSFPTIVGSGANSTVLHYTHNKSTMKAGDLVVVDMGAEYQYYCADITRTYPVSGTFTERQKEIYNIVLETQQYIADQARPGMWLSNKDQPDQSLNHLARTFLKDKGYDKYFPHGIGHFLGIDVHDVGDPKQLLQEGDVITIEPGIYIPEEQLGVRIEDNYWIIKDGAVCLSEAIPKKIEDIEQLVQSTF